MKQQFICTLIACFAAFTGGPILAQGSATDTVKPLPSVQFSTDNDVKSLSSALETGDPTTGHSTSILKAPPGCVVPWHSHTAEAQLIVINGTVVAEMTDRPPARLGPGGFAMMGSQTPHQFSCQGKATCLMVVIFDRAYDIHWGKGG